MFDLLPIASPLLYWGFIVLSVIVAGAVAFGINKTSKTGMGRFAFAIAAAWMGLTACLGWTGLLDAWEPPRMLFVLFPMLAWLAWSSRQPWTERLAELPLTILVGFQSFRIIVELLLHQAVLEGVAHPTMTWSGTNLDIAAGVTALLLAPFASRIDPRILQGWNVTMAAVLVVTVVTGILAAPSPFRQIMGNPPNGFVVGFPFVWLPTILVVSGWLGHIVLFRRLRRSIAASKSDPSTKRSMICIISY